MATYKIEMSGASAITVLTLLRYDTFRFLEEKKFDLTMMGAKGFSGALDLLIGSVSQRGVSSAKQAVLLI